jgi:hypothetical protein
MSEEKKLDHLFESSYDIDENGEVALETAKSVIVAYFDELKTQNSVDLAMQSAFDKVSEENQLDASQMEMVKNEIQDLILEIRSSAIKLTIGQ